MEITNKSKTNVYLAPDLNDKSKKIAEAKRQSRIQYLSSVLEKVINDDYKEIFNESN